VAWRVDGVRHRRHRRGRALGGDATSTPSPRLTPSTRRAGRRSKPSLTQVASYLVHDLGLDWRLGAEHFEELLVDYTPESNWGNWHAAAGLSGGRINRFNILKQSKDYDADGTYVKLWCPELAKVPAPSCHTPWLLSAADKERLGCGDYPPPLKTLGFKGPPPKKAKGGDRDKIKAKRRQKSRVQASYL